MKTFTSPLLAVAAFLFLTAAQPYAGGSVGSKTGVDVEALLKQPGVRFVVVNFHDTRVAAARAQVPAWESLVAAHRSDGLFVVTVTPLHPQFDRDTIRGPRCQHPGWEPDLFNCDAIGFVATGLGVEERPSSFLWTWPGRLLVRDGAPDEIRSAIRGELRRQKTIDKNVVPFRKLQMPTFSWGDPHEEARQSSLANLAKVTEPGSEDLVRFAREWIGTPYEREGNSKAGVDDYELVRAAYREVYDIDVGATRREQLRTNVEVPYALGFAERTLKPGDLIGWVVHADKIPRRVGVYLGNNMFMWLYMVRGVTVDPLPDYTWETYWAVARRPLATPQNFQEMNR